MSIENFSGNIKAESSDMGLTQDPVPLFVGDAGWGNHGEGSVGQPNESGRVQSSGV